MSEQEQHTGGELIEFRSRISTRFRQMVSIEWKLQEIKATEEITEIHVVGV